MSWRLLRPIRTLAIWYLLCSGNWRMPGRVSQARAGLTQLDNGGTRTYRLIKAFNRGGNVAEAYIVAAARTAGGRRNGKLRDWHPADLSAQVLNNLVDRAGVDPAAVEDVIMGCVSQ